MVLSPENMHDLLDRFKEAKRARLVDLIRRAAANGTAEEVAAAILPDWSPTTRIRPDGSIEVLGARVG